MFFLGQLVRIRVKNDLSVYWRRRDDVPVHDSGDEVVKDLENVCTHSASQGLGRSAVVSFLKGFVVKSLEPIDHSRSVAGVLHDDRRSLGVHRPQDTKACVKQSIQFKQKLN
jgi:hypothetical protein